MWQHKLLVKEAGVSRTTFYRNYRSLVDIVEDYLTVYPFGAASTEPYEPDNFDLRERLYDSFLSLWAERQLIYGLMDAGFERLLYLNYDMLIKGLCRQRAFEIGFRTEYELSAFVGMYFAICFDWIRGGMQESIDDMVDISYNILHTFYKNDAFAFPEWDDR